MMSKNSYAYSTQLNSTQREFTDAGETPHCPHLFITIKYKTIRHILITRTDLSPIPVRSAVKSNFTSWCIQNLSKRVLNWLTLLKGHSGAELHIYFLVHLESIYYQIFFYSKIVPNCALAK